MTTPTLDDLPECLAAYRVTATTYPFIRTAESAHALPDCLLFAVAWRETNMRNVVGDEGHGHGMWQLDDRSHRIGPRFDQNVMIQAVTAASMLQELLAWSGGRLTQALAAYNAGQGAVTAALQSGLPVDSVTTGRNYAGDVMLHLPRIHAEHIRLRSSSSLVLGPKP